jgi:hypothetical protein
MTVLYCSFCGKSQNDVAKLVAGPTVHICNECVDLCHEICHPADRPEAVVDTHAIDTHAIDGLLAEIRTLALTLESRTASLRFELGRIRRPPTGPAEIIGFGK